MARNARSNVSCTASSAAPRSPETTLGLREQHAVVVGDDRGERPRVTAAVRVHQRAVASPSCLELDLARFDDHIDSPGAARFPNFQAHRTITLQPGTLLSSE
jgi:hypothetical protein